MVEKIIVNPNEVRGYGNILSPHSSTDYELVDCTISSGTDTVNGASATVYTLTPTASHSYSLAFSSSSYTASGGSAEVSVTLTDNSVAVSGATITFTGGTSTVTGTTNSSGVATATISVTTTSTITATYGTATDTCTITVSSSYIINDDATTDNSSTLFGSYISLRNSGTASTSYTSASPSYYTITNTKSSAEAFVPFPALEGITSSFKVTIKGQNVSSSSYDACPAGLYYYLDSNNWGGVKDETPTLWVSDKTNGTFSEQSTNTGTSTTAMVIDEMIFDAVNNTLTLNQYNTSMTLLKTVTMNIPVTITSSVKWGTTTSWNNNTARKVYEIKAESLSPSPTPTGYSLAFSQDTYIIDFLGCTVSCTLTDDGTPLSGETVTFSWESLGSTSTATATTNSSGVATQGFDYFDFDSFPTTVTATYNTASATCTITDIE